MTKTIHAADLFCGAGGSSSGLLSACQELGIKPHLLAINHWDVAIATHSSNHPGVKHLCDDLENIDPRKVVPGGKLRLLVASPECIFFSNARGGLPVSNQGRASIKYILRWVTALEIQDVLIENVREFMDWGPLHRQGELKDRPIRARKGEYFRRFVSKLEAHGYRVEWRVLCAADYGDPTSRKRLFIRARKGNHKIVWPEPTHSADGKETLFGQLPSYRTAREIIDWENKGQSIFNRKRPLSPNTMKRIMAGLKKFGGLAFVLPNEGFYRGNQPRAEPFLVKMYGTSDAASLDKPLPTVVPGGHLAVAEPFVLGQQSGATPRSVEQPLPTIAGAGAISLIEPFVLAIRGGDDGYLRGASVDKPLPTITASPAMAVIEPFIFTVNHGKDDMRAYSMDKPLPTITSVDAWGMAEPYLVEYHGSSYEGGERVRSVDKPMPVVATSNQYALAQPFIVKYHGTSRGAYPVTEPLDTITGRDSYALAVPVQDGFVIVDILFRMLQPGELAKAHSFGEDYVFSGTREQKVKQIGNSVPCGTAKALCLAALS